MGLREKVSADLKNALREKRTLDLSVLRMLQSSIRNKEIDKKGKEELTDAEVIEVRGSGFTYLNFRPGDMREQKGYKKCQS